MESLFFAVLMFLTVRDTPQSEELPSIEEFKQDFPTSFAYNEAHEQEFSSRQIYFDYVLNNKLLWAIAISNAFVYLVRYAVLDWAPTYLSEEKEFSFDGSSWAYAFYEWAEIPGTIACGFLSDIVFQVLPVELVPLDFPITSHIAATTHNGDLYCRIQIYDDTLTVALLRSGFELSVNNTRSSAPVFTFSCDLNLPMFTSLRQASRRPVCQGRNV